MAMCRKNLSLALVGFLSALSLLRLKEKSWYIGTILDGQHKLEGFMSSFSEKTQQHFLTFLALNPNMENKTFHLDI